MTMMKTNDGGVGNKMEVTTLMTKNECGKKASQELRMLSNVTLNCQVAKIVMNSGSQLSEL